MKSTITFWVKSLFLLSIGFGLSACTTLAAVHRADNMTWSTTYLNQTECPNLAGVYEERAKLSSPVLTKLIADFHRRFENGSFSVVSYQPVPYTEMTDDGFRRAEMMGIRENFILKIEQPSRFVIEAFASDKLGKSYWKNTYRFEKMSPRFTVGCYQGAFVIRKVSIVSGEHTPAARTQANETHFTRLPNGDLQVTDTERAWSPSSETPRTKTTSEVFKLYRSNN